MLQILAGVALLAAAVILPIVAVHGVVQMYRHKDRRGAISGGISGMMTEFDRVVRPSVQHVIEAKESVVSREDDIGGD